MRLPIETNSIKFAAAGPADPVLGVVAKTAKSHEQGTPLVNVPHDCAGIPLGRTVL